MAIKLSCSLVDLSNQWHLFPSQGSSFFPNLSFIEFSSHVFLLPFVPSFVEALVLLLSYSCLVCVLCQVLLLQEKRGKSLNKPSHLERREKSQTKDPRIPRTKKRSREEYWYSQSWRELFVFFTLLDNDEKRNSSRVLRQLFEYNKKNKFFSLRAKQSAKTTTVAALNKRPGQGIIRERI